MRWYEPVPPRAALDGVLACPWTAQPTGRHRLVPDACIDLLWLTASGRGARAGHGELWLCGPETSAGWFRLPPGVEVHRWDLAVATALPGHATLDDEELTFLDAMVGSYPAEVMRMPGLFGPEVTPPAGADRTARLMAFLGRQS